MWNTFTIPVRARKLHRLVKAFSIALIHRREVPVWGPQLNGERTASSHTFHLFPRSAVAFVSLLRRCFAERQRRIISAGIYLQLQVTLNLFLVFSSVPSSKSQFIRFFLSARRKPLPSRITELPNCFFSLSFPSSLRLSLSLANAHYTRGLAAENARVTGLAMGKF